MTKPSKDHCEVDYPTDFQEATIEGARLPFKMQVRRVKTDSTHSSSGGTKQFQRSDDNSIFKTTSDTLMTWAGKYTGNKMFLWVSKTLAVDLGLSVTTHPPSSVHTQVLFLCEYLPMFVLTLCESKTTLSSEMKDTAESPYETVQESPNEVESFTALLTKKMMSSLLRFCYCDFIILPCTLAYDTFISNPDELTNEIELKLRDVRQYYGGPGYLDSRSYDAIKSAVDACMGMTYLPDILNELQTNTPVLMDPDWREMTLRCIETLCKKETLVSSEKESFKEKVALLEAARRLSFRDDVHVANCNRVLDKCIKDIVLKTEEDTGTRIKLKYCFLENIQKPEMIVVVDSGTAKCPACHPQSPELSLQKHLDAEIVNETVTKPTANRAHLTLKHHFVKPVQSDNRNKEENVYIITKGVLYYVDL